MAGRFGGSVKGTAFLSQGGESGLATGGSGTAGGRSAAGVTGIPPGGGAVGGATSGLNRGLSDGFGTSSCSQGAVSVGPGGAGRAGTAAGGAAGGRGPAAAASWIGGVSGRGGLPPVRVMPSRVPAPKVAAATATPITTGRAPSRCHRDPAKEDPGDDPGAAALRPRDAGRPDLRGRGDRGGWV